MLARLKKVVQVIKNMGWRYIIFRTGFELKKRTGLLKKKFPEDPEFNSFYTLAGWKKNPALFFFKNKEDLKFQLPVSDELRGEYKKLSEHIYPFFSSLEYKLGDNFDWVTNPDNGFKYQADKNWLDINDYSKEAGDIKFVWEPSRFSYLYTLIRYDQHSGVDCSAQVFHEIENWLDANKINRGPNFKCSQEISLRILNWCFAMYYYKDSPNLSAELFDKIQHYIYWQVRHVYDNINFSRIAVRNNHAITETLLLYIAGTIFPDYPDAGKWKKDGKRWFEAEIAYQIYEDGTFLQFSMNYHRVVVQLLTWALRLSDLNGDSFNEIVYDRCKKSIHFLLNSIEPNSGWLPNYGANDGALFFKLNNNHYRDYRPQLEALSCTLGITWDLGDFEDKYWYGIGAAKSQEKLDLKNGFSAFEIGGYYLYRKPESLSFIRCGNHKDRPSQADNLHLDIWHKGLNILHDAGSYKYNTDEKTLKYFMGSQSHNTIMLGDFDQMEKGPRFLWYYWSQCDSVFTDENDDCFIFEGTIKAFQHLDRHIRHKRRLTIHKNKSFWEIEDTIIDKPEGLAMKQLWHTRYPDILSINACSKSNKNLSPILTEGYFSSLYGTKEKCQEILFSTFENHIKTTIAV